MITLSAKPLIEKLNANLCNRVKAVTNHLGRSPKLAVVLVGDDPASVIYTNKKGKQAVDLGMLHESFVFPESATPEEVFATIERLNNDPTVDGILIQRPLPRSFREDEVMYWVRPEKDVDAFHPENIGRLTLGLPCFAPCTPAGVLKLLKHYEIPLEGKLACVIGRSANVGKPMATLLTSVNATVIHCHSRTKNLSSLSKQADVLVVAAGKPELIDGTFVRDGAVVVDIGIHRNADGKVIGDVKYADVAPKTSAITPVPGGVGPMTIMVLMENTIISAERSASMRAHQ